MPFDYLVGIQRILEDPLFDADEQRKNLAEFNAWLRLTRHCRDSTRFRYLTDLRVFRRLYGPRSFDKIDKETVSKYLSSRGEGTLKNDIIMLKCFLKFKDNMDAYHSFKSYKPEQKIPHILTDEEIETLMRAATTPYDLALIIIMYESACRIGELQNLCIGDLRFEQGYVNVKFRGKTGERNLPLVSSMGPLQNLLNHHPNRGDEDAVLFYGKNMDTAITQHGIRKKVNRLKIRAKIKRRIHPHLIRHTRATFLAKIFTEKELQLWLGHKDRTMIDVYVHLTGRDLAPKYLALHEKTELAKLPEEKIKETTCPRCQTSNISTDKFCRLCGLILDQKEAMKITKEQAFLDEFLQVLADPTKKEKFTKFLQQL